MRRVLQLIGLLSFLCPLWSKAAYNRQFEPHSGRLCDRPGGLLHWNHQLARLMDSLGDEATNKAFDGALRLTDVMAPLNEGALVDDLLRLDQLTETFVKSRTPEQRKLLREFLELQADRTSQDILDNGAKLPASFKDVFPKLYHCADRKTLIDYADDLGDGVWWLNADPRDYPLGRFLTLDDLLSSSQARDRLQLPLKPDGSGGFMTDPVKGRFKCIIKTEDVVDDLVIPKQGAQL